MSLLQTCFSGASGYVEVAVGGLTPKDRAWIPVKLLAEKGWDVQFFPDPVSMQLTDTYFGPAVRSVDGKMGKANCKGSWVVWVDYEEPQLPDTIGIIPPSVVIKSGRGHHLYWKLRDFCESQEALEAANASMAKALGGDNAHNIDRMLRVPGSVNTKYDPPPEVIVEYEGADWEYDIDQLMVLEKLDRKTVHKIVTGDRRGFKSRSERDWSIVRSLMAAGADEPLIHYIFEGCKCGDKYREMQIKGPLYLTRTIQKLKESGVSPKSQGTADLIARDNCYFLPTSKGEAQISTFILEPTLLLEDDVEDSLVCDVHASGTSWVWKDQVFPRSSFNGVYPLSKQLSKAAWIWLGRDSDVRLLLSCLVTDLQEKGVPRARSTKILGRHTLSDDGRSFYVATDSVLASDGSVWPRAADAPIMYVDSGKEHPDIEMVDLGVGDTDVQHACSLIPRLNTPGVIWAMLGWFCACPMKPAIEKLGYRFPILNITGTKGSGKTSLVTRVFQPMAGYRTPRTYDVGTTNFVKLALLGCANAIGIAFSEYRAATESDFLRQVLLAYDTGRDARGNPDQTTTQYPLCAPFSLDGEDKMEDPAALERMVVVVLSPQTIREGSDSWQAFQEIMEMDLRILSYPYIMHTLKLDVAALLEKAEREVFKAFPMNLPDRVRRNLTVAWLGVLSFSSFAEMHGTSCMPQDGASVLGHALENVYSVSLGRAPIAADDFVEYIINAAAGAARDFLWNLEEGVLWFQLAPAYSSYTGHMARHRAQVLSKNALRIQLAELQAEYMIAPQVKTFKGRKTMAYGVSLERAMASGLDVPESFNPKAVIFEFG